MSKVTRWFPQIPRSARWGLLLLPGLLLTQGCDDGTSPGVAQVQVRLTDAPADIIASAEVWISRIYLQGCEEPEVEGEEEEGCEPVDLFNNPVEPHMFDLLTLQDGTTADLTGMVNVEAKIYRQLRLVVDSARVTLVEGFTFEGAEDPFNVADLKVPSGSSSGIKVHLDQAINTETEEVTTVLVDFDVADNFKLQGPVEGPEIMGVTFTPTLKEKGRSHGEG